MSNNLSDNKKRKGANGAAIVPIKVESSHQQGAGVGGGPPPPDDSKLTPIQQIIWVELWKDDSNAVEEALRELHDLSDGNNPGNTANAELVFRTGGPTTIVGAMRKWHGVPAIQVAGCRALCNIAHFYNGFAMAGKETGAIDAVVWAMGNYPNDCSIQLDGIGSLTNFVRITANSEYFVKELDGVKLVVAAMKSFKDMAQLQKNASSALLQLLLSYNEDGCTKAIVKAGGRKALLEAVETHDDETTEHVKDLQRKAREALKKLL